jgi:hypothetical protein
MLRAAAAGCAVRFSGISLAARRALSSRRSTRASKPPKERDSRITLGHNRARRGRWSPRRQVHLAYRFFQRGSQSTHTHAAAMCGYCGASARIKFDDEQFAALFNEFQARGDKNKLMQLFGH